MFGRLLSYLQLNPRRVKIRENGEKRSFSIYRVGTVAEALTVLETVLSLTAS
jgi:hypothetical protein